jgi:hypothetical protein
LDAIWSLAASGQCGPWLTGEASDRSYGVAGSLLLSGGILAGAAAIALLLRDTRRPISAD